MAIRPEASHELDTALVRLVELGIASYGDGCQTGGPRRDRLVTRLGNASVDPLRVDAVRNAQEVATQAELPFTGDIEVPDALPHDKIKFKLWLADLADKEAVKRAEQLGIPADAVRRARNLPIPKAEQAS